MAKAKPEKYTWWYYICSHGPGHQSETEGFVQYSADLRKEKVKEYVEDEYLSNLDSPVTRVWKVKRLPQAYLDKQIKSAEGSIRYYKELLATLKGTKATSVPERKIENGWKLKQEKKLPPKDQEVVAALANCVRHSLMKQLHQRGVYVTSSTVGYWWRGESVPTGKMRSKVIEAGKASERYKG